MVLRNILVDAMVESGINEGCEASCAYVLAVQVSVVFPFSTQTLVMRLAAQYPCLSLALNNKNTHSLVCGLAFALRPTSPR